MVVTFISNYINHHQIPFCNAMEKLCDFTFLQTEPMEEERVNMGWNPEDVPAYVRRTYDSPEENASCRQLLMDSDVVIYGSGCGDSSFVMPRMLANKLTFRYDERCYKTGQWKALTPRGLRHKFKDHTRFRNKNVFLLCAGAYVASDYGIFSSYPGKMFKWGYFPEFTTYDLDTLMKGKGYLCENKALAGVADSRPDKIPYFLWAGRFIDWKHPEIALETARYMKERGLAFHLDIIGGGPMEEELKDLCKKYDLEDCVSFLGYKQPGEVRSFMEKADVYLFTSDRNEGWGVVANEAMNSGCAVIANHMIGAVPYLISNGMNGCIYPDKDRSILLRWAVELCENMELREYMGRNAYETLRLVWNPENAAASFMKLATSIYENLQKGNEWNDSLMEWEESFWEEEKEIVRLRQNGPCTYDQPRSEKAIEERIFHYKEKAREYK